MAFPPPTCLSSIVSAPNHPQNIRKPEIDCYPFKRPNTFPEQIKYEARQRLHSGLPLDEERRNDELHQRRGKTTFCVYRQLEELERQEHGWGSALEQLEIQKYNVVYIDSDDEDEFPDGVDCFRAEEIIGKMDEPLLQFDNVRTGTRSNVLMPKSGDFGQFSRPIIDPRVIRFVNDKLRPPLEERLWRMTCEPQSRTKRISMIGVARLFTPSTHPRCSMCNDLLVDTHELYLYECNVVPRKYRKLLPTNIADCPCLELRLCMDRCWFKAKNAIGDIETLLAWMIGGTDDAPPTCEDANKEIKGNIQEGQQTHDGEPNEQSAGADNNRNKANDEEREESEVKAVRNSVGAPNHVLNSATLVSISERNEWEAAAEHKLQTVGKSWAKYLVDICFSIFGLHFEQMPKTHECSSCRRCVCEQNLSATKEQTTLLPQTGLKRL